MVQDLARGHHIHVVVHYPPTMRDSWQALDVLSPTRLLDRYCTYGGARHLVTVIVSKYSVRTVSIYCI